MRDSRRLSCRNNLTRAIERHPHVLVFDNRELSRPYRVVDQEQLCRPISPSREAGDRK